jgi:hypothetical protein
MKSQEHREAKDAVITRYEVARNLIKASETDMSGRVIIFKETLDDYIAGVDLLLEQAQPQTSQEEIQNMKSTISEQALLIEGYQSDLSRIAILGRDAAKFSSTIEDIANHATREE